MASVLLEQSKTDTKQNIKLTLTSPSWYHFRYGPNKAYTKGTYANDDEYFADVAKAYQTELKILYDNGLRNAQVDDPNLACLYLIICAYLKHADLTL